MRQSPTRKLETIIFDFDGTLAELRLDFGEMKRRIGMTAERYLHFTPDGQHSRVLEWLDVLDKIVEQQNGHKAGEFRKEAEAVITRMELDAAHQGSLFPFTRPLLDRLRERRIKVAIITRNCAAAVRTVFPDIDGHCAAFLARDHVPRVKPDPDHLLRALHKAFGSAETALMVGDHPIDIETGKCAGVLTAGVWSGSATEGDLARSGADWIARDCEELARTLEDQGLI